MLYKINLNNFYGDFLIPQSLLEASKKKQTTKWCQAQCYCHGNRHLNRQQQRNDFVSFISSEC